MRSPLLNWWVGCRDARGQQRQRHRVAADQRHGLNGVRAHHSADLGGVGLQERSFAGDGDALGHSADLHRYVDARPLVDFEVNSGLMKVLKPVASTLTDIYRRVHAEKHKYHRLLVLVGNSVPRSRSLAVTVAPEIAAPEGSVIVPVIPALTSCAHTGRPARQAKAHNNQQYVWKS